MAKVKGRGQDWVNFTLKPEAPAQVALGGARFAARFRRADEPFRVTRGEWTVFLAPLGFFIEAEASPAELKKSKTLKTEN
ncbi:MAG: hypothetical protein WC485_01005 [Opitutaceae bacterium]